MTQVSIIIPCRDESAFIDICLASIIANDYPKDRLEVLVMDGMSEDGTREIVERYAKEYPFIRLLDNPKKITPCALNTGIKYAKGEIIIRMDAHATYEKRYVSKCVKYMRDYNADNIGGRMVTVPRNNTFIGKTIVIALSHRFGVGGSSFRIGSKEPKWVDTVFGGCYKKEVFDKIGLFNENLARGQDMEFSLRLKKGGRKTLLVPKIVSCYYVHSDFKSFYKHNFRNGVWAIYPFKFTNTMPVSLRHLVPFGFVSSLIGSGILALFSPVFLWLFVLIVCPYILINLYFSIKISIEKKEARLLFLMPIIFASLHISYGLGSIWGAIKLLGS